MANHDVTSYKIGNDTYYYRDNQSLIALDNKVDKEEGKELSSNDYTDEDKEKLAELENITVDDFLSTGSENPVQNKVLTEEINGIKDSRATSQNFGLAKAGLGLISEQGVLSIDSNYSPYTLPEATSETLGGIKIGEGLSIDDGTLSADSVDIATDQTPGIVQIGEGLDIDENGVLSVKIDNVISSESENPVQNKIIAQALIDNRYTLPIASENTLGGIKVGNNLTIDANGTLNAEAGGASALEDLSDVDITSLADGEVLVYNGTSEKWENKEVPSGTDDYSDLDNKPSINSVTLNGNKTSSDLGIVITLTQAQYNALSTEEKNDTNKVYYITDSSGGGGTVEVSMADITDVEFSSLSDGQILKYDAANSQWVNDDEAGGSSALVDLEDVNISNPTDGQVLKYDATSEEWINDDDAGGTEVEANPAGEATADLEKIQIGETIYDLPKIGSSYKEIVLYHSNTDENTYILSQPITNFDAIVVTAQFTGAVSNAFSVRTFLVSELEEYIGETNQFEISSNDDYIWFGITDASTFTKKAQDDFKIIKIVGVQYGSGLGENSEIINISSGDGTTSRTFTLSKTPKFVAISWDEIDGWSRYHNFVWGDKRAYGFAGNTDSALSNQYATVVKITYGADNKSFTITGSNASATFNTTTGNGRLYLEYGEGGSEGGGTSVEANPQEEPTDSLETIKIGDTVYDIPGGGGSYTKDLIYENTSGVSGSSQQIIVTKAVTDYDVISVVYSTYNDGGYSTRGESYYSPPYQKDSTNFKALWYPTYGNRWIVLEGTPGATIVTLSTGVYGEGSGYTPIIYEIYGIKFGSGSGGGSSYIEDILYNPTTPSSSSSWSSPINTEISKTDVEKYDMLVFGIGCDDHTRTFGYLLPSRLNDSKSSVLLTINEEATVVKNCYIIYNTNDELCVYTNTGTTTYVFDVTGIKFGSGGGGSGTEVEANPQDEPTDTLETIKIGNTVYDIAGSASGGGKYSLTLLWDYVNDNSGSILYGLTSATLNGDIDDFDELLIEVVSISTDPSDVNWNSTCQFHINVEALNNAYNNNYILCESCAGRTSRYYIHDNILEKTSQATANTNGLVRVYGLKINGSGNSKIETLFTGDGSESTYNLTDSIKNYDLIEVQIRYSQGGNYRAESVFDVETFTSGITYRVSADDWYVGFVYTDNTTFSKVDVRNAYISEIKGLKFSGGGGTEVEANPSDSPADTLETIKIGDVVYDIAGSNLGSKYERTVLYNTDTALPAVLTLSDNIDNFDAIEIIISYEQTNLGKTSYIYDAKKFVNDFPYVANPNGIYTPHLVISDYYPQYSRFICGDAPNKIWCYASNYGYIREIAGIKYGSGGSIGSVSEIVTELNTAIADGTTVTLNLTKKYNDPYVMATNVLPKSSWGGIVTVDESYGVTYDRGNNTISFKVYTNKGQNYDINWLVFDLSNDTFAQNNYSTTEQVAGTWVDGKTIYKTTIDPISSSSNGQQQVSLSTYGISNVDTICKIEGVVLTSGGSVALNYFNGSGDCFNLFMTSNNTIIVLAHYGSWTNSIQTYITLYYTKTSS